MRVCYVVFAANVCKYFELRKNHAKKVFNTEEHEVISRRDSSLGGNKGGRNLFKKRIKTKQGHADYFRHAPAI